MLVGNGVTNWTYDTLPATMELLYWRSLIDEELHDAMKAENCDYSRVNFDITSVTKECMDYLTNATNYIDKVNIYNIYGTCWGLNDEQEEPEVFDYTKNFLVPKPFQNKKLQITDKKLTTKKKVNSARDLTPWLFPKSGELEGSNELPPCTFGEPILEYLNNATIKE